MDNQDPTAHTPVASIFGQPEHQMTVLEKIQAATQADDVVVVQPEHEANLTASADELIAQAQPLYPDLEEAYLGNYTDNTGTSVECDPVSDDSGELTLDETLPVSEDTAEQTEAEAMEAYEADTPVEITLEPEVQETVTEAVQEPEQVIVGADFGSTPSVSVMAAVIPAIDEVAVKPKSKRGFASMTPERRREIAAKGGRNVPVTSRYFSQSHQNAAEAGRIGGRVKGPRKPKAKPEAVTVVAEPLPTVTEPAVETVPTDYTVFDSRYDTDTETTAQVEQVVEAVTEPMEQTAVEAAPASPIETIVEGEPEIPEYLRRLAGGGSINI
jgi:general stress protein YciG